MCVDKSLLVWLKREQLKRFYKVSRVINPITQVSNDKLFSLLY